MKRSFSYIEDISKAILKILFKIPKKSKLIKKITSDISEAPYQIYNLGNSRDVKLLDYIKMIEIALDKISIKTLLKLQLGDVISTKANMYKAKKEFNLKINTPIKYGIPIFVDWFKKYYSK